MFLEHRMRGEVDRFECMNELHFESSPHPRRQLLDFDAGGQLLHPSSSRRVLYRGPAALQTAQLRPTLTALALQLPPAAFAASLLACHGRDSTAEILQSEDICRRRRRQRGGLRRDT